MSARILVDTHVFLWALAQPSRLSPKARSIFQDEQTELLLSVASIWEIAIKTSLGKLELPEPVHTYVPSRLEVQQIGLLHIRVSHALGVASLPFHHRDPFDRLLVAQAKAERVPLMTADATFSTYGVERVW